MKLLRILFFIFFCCFSQNNLWAQNIIVNDTYTAQQLVENVLINSPCANVSNFSVSGGNFASGEKSYGYFSAGTSSFPFSNGVVLSTSTANNTQGPNTSLLSDDAPGWIGDPDLEQALSISNTSNATVLEFDFTPLTSQISFDYIFASEEYHDTAPCHYSDGFAFLLKVAGSPDNYQNLALIPNTAIPVKVTTVHPNISGGSGCPAQNETYFGSYNDNAAPINFNGQTTIMTAKATVIPGTTYHIKLVIADETNPKYDSAIFLGGGSFNVGTDLGPDRLIATNNPLCNSDTYLLDATEPGTNTYKWFKDNVELLGETNPTYTVTSAGTYSVEITLNSTTCIAKGEVTIEYAGSPVIAPLALEQCDDNNDGIATFNLTKLTPVLQGSTAANTVTYYTSLYNAQHQLNPISNTSSFQNTSTNQVVAAVSNAYGCNSYVTITLQIANNSLPAVSPIPICDEDGTLDGFTSIDLNQQVTPTVLNGLPAGLIAEYYLTAADATNQTNVLPNSFTNTLSPNQTIFARIVNGPDCYGIIPISLQLITFNPANFNDESLFLCNGETESLSVPLGFSSYTWNTGATTSSISITTSGTYTVTVTNSYGCSVTKKFIVLSSSAPIITSVDIGDFSGNSNTVQVNVSGSGDYEYSLNGIHFQSSSLFTDVTPKEYTIIVRDKNGCNPNATKHIYVLDYPKYFTPNGDGINDTWQIKNLFYYPQAVVTIFDRYGKFIYSFDANHPGWNGKLNQQELFADDYWFVITLNNGRIIKGHFALKR
ncbi:T9SS type B sorting domain-containing protein [Flavobacterium silvisoli]|uniref:T9SS type B sorting domain-containing protein n=1 Tax=Flavobacterium silvisoli TaxID=2529433 RepID=A0A4Q9Z4G4_9FLAO|nr:choice-of-anchor L domain-containing protein [Flavobacterium silvisoli]TBX68796.1 T9SS type B sorting domain-containing protein [Flavobacterium silvisoli]